MKFLILGWTAFTTTLAIWWWILGLRMVNALSVLPGANLDQIQSQHWMFMTEGTVLVALIIFGGCALGFSTWKVGQKNLQMREFFATFSHEVKTSLTNLQIQAEVMEEENNNPEMKQPLRRLMQETRRLSLQLENSLWVAQGSKGKVFNESLDLKNFLTDLSQHWPGLEVEVKGLSKPVLRTDRRGLEIIFRNLLQNALIHGEASKVEVQAQETPDRMMLKVRNNGTPFNGEQSLLGRMFARQNHGSGTGIGLALVQRLMNRLGGEANFKLTNGNHLEVTLAFARGVS